MNEHEPWDEPTTAAWLGVHPDTLRRWRRAGTGPDWIRMGRRLVRYRPIDVTTWMHQQATATAGSSR